jgi:hypothetical protein
MSSIANNGYSKAQALAALSASRVRYVIEYRLLNNSNQYLRTLPTVQKSSGEITSDATRDTAKSLTIAYDKEDDFELDIYAERIEPRMLIPMSAVGTGSDSDGTAYLKYSLGIFQPVKVGNTTRKDGSTVFKLEADDLSILLSFKATAAYSATAADRYTDFLKTIVNAAGLTKTNIQYSSRTFPQPIEFARFSTRFEIVKKICESLDYEWFVEGDTFYARARVDDALRPLLNEFSVDNNSIIFTEATNIDRSALAANYIFASVSQLENGTSFEASASNTNENSPLSIPRRGFTIPRVLDKIDITLAPNQLALQAIVDSELARESRISRKGTLSIGKSPYFSVFNLIRVYKPSSEWDGLFTANRWRLPLAALGRMEIEIEEVEATS